jgi:hypothetical protein
MVLSIVPFHGAGFHPPVYRNPYSTSHASGSGESFGSAQKTVTLVAVTRPGSRAGLDGTYGSEDDSIVEHEQVP